MSIEKKLFKEQEKKEKEEIKDIIKEKKEQLKEEERNRPLTPKEERIRELNKPPVRSTLEEIGNSITHGLGALFAIFALIILSIKSTSTLMLTASLVYGFSMFIMMLMSCLYHAWKTGSKVKRLWRRFDYSSIYLLIGGTFAPLQLIELGQNQNHPVLALIWFGIMWIGIIVGITMTCIFGPGRIKWLNYPMYFVLGWSGVMFIPGWIQFERWNLIWWILGGGIAYTLGMIPFAFKKIHSTHFIWHIFVLIGVVTHFVGIYLTLFI